MFKKLIKKKFDLSIGILIFRLTLGSLMLTHGYGKFIKLINGNFKFADPIGLGQEISLTLTVFSEFVCAILLILGLFTRWATIPLLITMLVAALIIHGDDPISTKEKALLYSAGFIMLFYTGGGKYSLDKQLI